MVWAAVYAVVMPTTIVTLACWPLLKNLKDGAAWVQAIGSVGAIFVAVIVDQGAGRRAALARLEEQKSRDEAILVAIELTWTTLADCSQDLAKLVALAQGDSAHYFVSRDRLLLHQRSFLKRKLLLDHYLGAPMNASPLVMQALTIARPELGGSLHRLDELLAQEDSKSLIALDDRLNDATAEIMVAITKARTGRDPLAESHLTPPSEAEPHQYTLL